MNGERKWNLNCELKGEVERTNQHFSLDGIRYFAERYFNCFLKFPQQANEF